MKKRVAIIGSELSYELFDRNNPIIDAIFEVALYRKNASLISVMSPSLDYDYSQLKKELTFAERQQIIDELSKDTLTNLIALQPDLIVLDFYSHVFEGVVQTEGRSFLTNNLENMQETYSFSGIKFKKALNSNRSVQDFIDYSKVWCKAFDSFLEFVQRFLPDTLLLVNAVDFSKVNPRKDNRSQTWFRFNEYAKNKEIPIISDSMLEICQYTFDNFKPKHLKNFLELNNHWEEKKISENALAYNLIKNANFNVGKKYWHDDNGEYFVKNGVLEIQRESMEGFTILHSTPIQISNNENKRHKFELSMEVWVENLFALHLNDAFFYVWIYEDKVERKIQETKIYSAKLGNLSSGKWKKVKIKLEVMGKYLELGPHMVGAGHFRYRNLSLRLVDERE